MRLQPPSNGPSAHLRVWFAPMKESLRSMRCEFTSRTFVVDFFEVGFLEVAIFQIFEFFVVANFQIDKIWRMAIFQIAKILRLPFFKLFLWVLLILIV